MIDSLIKVAQAHEIARVEKSAFEEGVNEESLMLEAGRAVATATLAYIESHKLSPLILLLVGKGNNGADAYVAGIYLLEKGISVKALQLNQLKKTSALCQKYGEKFQKQGGVITEITTQEQIDFEDASLLIDGLLGTGFRGQLEGVLLELVNKANASRLPIISVDIPSGVDGNTGEVETSAIQAMQTVCLSLPKTGFFLNQGWNHVGRMILQDIGLPKKYYEKIKEDFYWLEKMSKKCLPSIVRSRHKYEAGSIVAICGAIGMEGAAKLCCLAALRTGAGIVKLFLPKEMTCEMATFPKEIVKNHWDENNTKGLIDLCNRSSCVMIGPGIGRSETITKLLHSLLPYITSPTVIDADGLYFLAHNPKISLPEKTILTPHHDEMRRLLAKEIKGEKLISQCQNYCREKRVLLVLKGGPTFVFSPEHSPVVITKGDPGMATAGTGDVLTGVISAFLSEGLNLWDAAMLGIYLHGISGELAAEEKTSYGIIASDLIEKLPEAIKCLD